MGLAFASHIDLLVMWRPRYYSLDQEPIRHLLQANYLALRQVSRSSPIEFFPEHVHTVIT